MRDDTGVPGVTLAGSSLAFVTLGLEEALLRVAELGFRHVDLAAVPGWAHVEPAALAAGPRERERVQVAATSAGLDIVALNAALGASGAEANMRCQALVETAAAVGARLVTLQPPPAGTPLDEAVETLGPIADIARKTGVRISLEIHRGGLTEIPADAAALAVATGLGLTLDPSHITAGPAQGAGFELVLPYVDHLHVRDASRDPLNLQLPIGEGDVDFPSLFRSLVERGYSGVVSIEYVGRSEAESEAVSADAVAAAQFVAATWPGPIEGAEAFATR